MGLSELFDAVRAPALAALATLLLAALLGRLAPRAAGVAVGLGLAAGLFDLVGVRLVTPRLLPERLPWLVLGAAALGVLCRALSPRGRPAVAVAGALVGTWWMLGAPRQLPDLRQVAPDAPALLVGFLLASAPWAPTGGAGPALLVGLAAAAMAGAARLAGAPALVSALSLATAAAAAAWLLARRGAEEGGDMALLPLAAGLAGAASVAWLSVSDAAVRLAVAAPLVVQALARAAVTRR